LIAEQIDIQQTSISAIVQRKQTMGAGLKYQKIGILEKFLLISLVRDVLFYLPQRKKDGERGKNVLGSTAKLRYSENILISLD
jgi:hypothetical protein